MDGSPLAAWHCIVLLYCTKICYDMLCCNVLYGALKHSIVPFGTALYCTVLNYTILSCNVLHCTVLHFSVRYHIVMYRNEMHCTVLY